MAIKLEEWKECEGWYLLQIGELRYSSVKSDEVQELCARQMSRIAADGTVQVTSTNVCRDVDCGVRFGAGAAIVELAESEESCCEEHDQTKEKNKARGGEGS